jgi:hypothetical protein
MNAVNFLNGVIKFSAKLQKENDLARIEWGKSYDKRTLEIYYLDNVKFVQRLLCTPVLQAYSSLGVQRSRCAKTP